MEPLTIAKVVAALALVLGAASRYPDGYTLGKIQVQLRLEANIDLTQNQIRKVLESYREQFFRVERGRWKRK